MFIIYNKSKTTPFKVITVVYLFLLFFFFLLFLLPISQSTPISTLDAFFLSSSAISITGLSTFDVSEHLSLFGQILLLIEIQIGGLGIMVILGSLFLLFKQKLSISQQNLLKHDTNQNNLSSVKKLTFFIILYALIIEVVASIYFYIYFRVHQLETGQELFTSIFHAIASFTNAGFDVFSNNMTSFQHEPFFLIVSGVLIVLGAIGFPSVLELVTRKKHNKVSLYTKINLIMHSILLIFGTLFILFIEWQRSLSNFSLLDKVANAFFLSSSTRNGGFETFSIELLSPSTLLLFLLLMFIGGSASSSSGGIRVTTFFIIVAQTVTKLLGKKEIVVFKKSLYDEDIDKAHAIFIAFSATFFVSTFIISLIEGTALLPIAFEVMSALTTTGLSLGITSELHALSQLLLCVLMIVGRIGIVVFMYSFINLTGNNIRYKKEKIIIG